MVLVSRFYCSGWKDCPYHKSQKSPNKTDKELPIIRVEGGEFYCVAIEASFTEASAEVRAHTRRYDNPVPSRCDVLIALNSGVRIEKGIQNLLNQGGVKK